MKVALVGVGNPLRSDDYVGSYVVKTIIRAGGTHFRDVYLIDAENNVESLITKIQSISAAHVIFVDACQMGLEPGSVNLLAVEDTSYPFFTTHGIPLKLLAERLLSGSKVWVLAVEPNRTDFGEGLTREITDSAITISRLVMENLSSGGRLIND
jgi:hydrogenase 3 maturation protease